MQKDTYRLASYDADSIGQEFAESSRPVTHNRATHSMRRAEVAVQEWKNTLGESHAIPKSNLANACRFDTRRVYSESLITWSVMLVLSTLAGAICVLVIRHVTL